MNLPGLIEFIAVIDAGSFTKAAEKLVSSKSRLSQQVTRLEKHLGVQLIHRSTRSLRLTEVGEQFYQQSKQGLQLLELAAQQAQEDQSSLRGRIRINSVGGIFGEQVLAPAVISFMLQQPLVQIDVDFNSAHVDLITEHYDLAIRMGELPDSQLIARTLMTVDTYICASPSYIQQHGQPHHPHELAQHRCVYGSIRRWKFKKKHSPSETAEVNIDGPLFCPNGYVQKYSALQGLGIVKAPSYYLQQAIDSGKLIQLMPEWEVTSSLVSVVYPKSKFKIRRIQALVEFLVERFKNTPVQLPVEDTPKQRMALTKR